MVFQCPWRSEKVDSVKKLKSARIAVSRGGDAHTVEVAVPLATLGFDPQPGKSYKLDLGVIFSDATGTTWSLRMYWANKATGLVNDVPGEIVPTPNLWGDGQFTD